VNYILFCFLITSLPSGIVGKLPCGHAVNADALADAQSASVDRSAENRFWLLTLHLQRSTVDINFRRLNLIHIAWGGLE
jgi:hypothetical protein